jgi:hypothetical protein
MHTIVAYENGCVLLQAQLEKEASEDAHYRAQLEQERRDHELALRLAQETNDQLEEMSPQDNRRYVHIFSQNYDLFQRKYITAMLVMDFTILCVKLNKICTQYNHFNRVLFPFSLT